MNKVFTKAMAWIINYGGSLFFLLLFLGLTFQTNAKLPLMRGRTTAKSNLSQVVEIWSFWLMTVSIVFLTVAGILQVYLQRATENPQLFMAAQEKIDLFYWLREIVGLVLFIGLLVYLWSFFIKVEETTQSAS